MDQDQKPVIGPDGKPKTEEVEVTLPCFKAITVFDIEQTTGEPIRTLAPEILTAAVEDFDLFLQAIREISPVPRSEKAITQRSPVLQEQCETIRLPNASWQEVLNCDWIQSSTDKIRCSLCTIGT